MNNIYFNPTWNVSTLVDILRYRALHESHHPAYRFLVDGETKFIEITYAELDRRARGIAVQLQNQIETGQRALLLYPPSLDYIAAFFGCLYAGVTAVPAYPPQPGQAFTRTQAIARDAQVAVVLTDSANLATVQQSLANILSLKSTHCLATDSITATLGNDEWKNPGITSDMLALIQYTSGSTAAPKGVMISHGNLFYNEEMIKQAFGHTKESVIVGWLPFYHDMGLIGNVLQPLYIGVLAVLMSPLAFLKKPVRWLQAISRYKATTSGAPSFAYDLCVSSVTPEQRMNLDLTSWSVAFNGAEPIRYETLQRFVATFGSCGFRWDTFYPCYGLAEATLFVSGGLKTAPPVIHFTNKSELERHRVVTVEAEDNQVRVLVGCGRAWMNQKILIVDPITFKVCPPYQIGEIWVSGPSIAQGYWNQAQETEAIFYARLANNGEGRFLRTGDLGFLKDGELFITSRLKDLIIINGRNHYPQDIEQTVEQSHLALRASCSAAFSVDIAGAERLVIITEISHHYQHPMGDSVQLTRLNLEGRALLAKSVIEAIQQAVSKHHGISPYKILLLRTGSILKTSSGKIQRHACRISFLDGTLNIWGE